MEYFGHEEAWVKDNNTFGSAFREVCLDSQFASIESSFVRSSSRTSDLSLDVCDVSLINEDFDA
jgi:hypothetical protein